MSTTIQAAPATPHPWDDVLVLREFTLRAGFDLTETQRFVGMRWDCQPAVHQQHIRKMTLRFDTVATRYQIVAKEIICCYMAMPLPAGEERVSLATIRTQLSGLRKFFKWLSERPGQPTLADLTVADLADYLKFLKQDGNKKGHLPRSLAAVRRIWLFRGSLPGDRLLIDPAQVEGWSQKSKRRRENLRGRIPEEVLAPLIVWATRFVDEFAPDILAVAREWAQLRANEGSLRLTGHRPDLGPALEGLMAEHVARSWPLPGHRGSINTRHLARTLKASRSVLDRNPRYLGLIDATAQVVGVDARSYFYTEPAVLLDGERWIDRISTEHGDYSLPALARNLQLAAYTLIAFYSGMRDSEVKHLKRGCLEAKRDESGNVYRWKVNSLAFKSELDETGVPASWVVGAPAARAVTVLEALQGEDVELLFQALPYGAGWRDGLAGRALTSTSTNIGLNRFSGWVDRYCAQRGRLDGIPKVGGRPFKLMTSQFRRTLAWFVARQPGGAIAGAIQYRHLSIQMFEGYAGTSDSGFRAEVESEQALARGEQLMDLTDTHRHEGIAGPGAAEAVRRLEEFGHRTAGFAGTVVTDKNRLKRIMTRNDPGIYPSKYVTCVHQHSKALCEKKAELSGKIVPDLGDCKPLLCQNTALTPANIVSWEDEIARIDRQLARRPALPPLLQHNLTGRKTDIEVFLARHAREKAAP
ncbi:site-specific integrase [Actinomadura geliboluensis]|uniref:site-specific integrase n=1 Tax=Actinomadura geliboluensis TaxID=882440 RepID=UPI0037146B1B